MFSVLSRPSVDLDFTGVCTVPLALSFTVPLAPSLAWRRVRTPSMTALRASDRETEYFWLDFELSHVRCLELRYLSALRLVKALGPGPIR